MEVFSPLFFIFKSFGIYFYFHVEAGPRVICLRSSVFDLWNKRKRSLGFKDRTNSILAEFLLHKTSVTEDTETRSKAKSRERSLLLAEGTH